MAAKPTKATKTAPKASSAPKPAPARLGGDLAPPARGEPLNLIVARSHIVGGTVRVELQAPAVARGAPGGKLLVKHAYRLQEDSKEREEYRFLLRSRLGPKEHAPSLARYGDAYGVPEDIGGFLVHEYVLPAKGPVTLEFEVGAEYTIGSWKSVDVDHHEVKQLKAEIQIQL